MNITQNIIHIAAQILGVPPTALDAGTTREQIAQWDSVRNLNLILAIEQQLGIEFGDQEIMAMASIGEIAAAAVKRGAAE